MSFTEYEVSKEGGSRVELYLFETDDGRYRWAYTTDSRAKTLGPVVYEPLAVKRGELKQTAGDANVETVQVTVPFDLPVAALHVPYLPPRPVRLTIFAYQRDDPGAEITQAFTGYISSFNQVGVEAIFECSQILDNLSQLVPWAVFKSGCVWALYQVGCGVDKALWRRDALVTSVDGDRITSAEFASKPDGWYTNGFIHNPETGEQRFITQHIGDTILVIYPFMSMPAGLVLDAYAGCARTKSVCSEKFDNKINYLGFDYFPEYNVFQQGIT